MANKLPQGTFPSGSGPNDFQCFGPPAMNDGDFENSRICDMGCFTQDGKDSNKYYHAAVVQHKSTKKWYAYFEWGRTGAKSPSFQFVECLSEGEAVPRRGPRHPRRGPEAAPRRWRQGRGPGRRQGPQAADRPDVHAHSQEEGRRRRAGDVDSLEGKHHALDARPRRFRERSVFDR